TGTAKKRRRTSGGSTGASQRSRRPPPRWPRECDSPLKACRSPGLGRLALPSLAVVAEDVQGARPVPPADDFDGLVLEQLVRLEEVLDLDEAVRAHLVHLGDVRLVRVADADAQDLVVVALLVAHLVY